MGAAAQRSQSPQARGRELARQGKDLYIEFGSVSAAARELMNRHQDLPSIQHIGTRRGCHRIKPQPGTTPLPVIRRLLVERPSTRGRAGRERGEAREPDRHRRSPVC